ncbi:MAG TPA: CAP domain-containing protein [Solirubrobacterales bacterium]|nr:CAP domain-containing protein [Solirubrobacterales bacterium]
MIRIGKRNSRPLVGVLVILVAGAVVGVLSAFTAAADPAATSSANAEACPEADTPAIEATTREVRKWVRCRINEERAVHGVNKVALNDSLRKAATRHAKVMVDTRCLAHKCPGEPNLDTRIRRSGYPRGADSWEYAEDTGCGVSADAMIGNWLAIQFHRINILNETFDDVGVGVVREPVKGRCDKDFATFAVVFGHREPSG